MIYIIAKVSRDGKSQRKIASKMILFPVYENFHLFKLNRVDDKVTSLLYSTSNFSPRVATRKRVVEEGGRDMPKKILAVDDERNIVRLIQVNLERAGYEVITAFDGREALKKIEEERPDMVVLDVMMPYMDGFETLKQIRANPATRSMPVVMLTAKAQDQDVFQGYSKGADIYLTKPFNPMELLTFVKRIFTELESA